MEYQWLLPQFSPTWNYTSKNYFLKNDECDVVLWAEVPRNIDLKHYFQGVGGTVQLPKNFLKPAYELVKSYGGVCIADEVSYI